MAIGLVTLVALTFGTSIFAQRAADREALAEARSLHSVLALAIAKPGLSQGLFKGRLGEIDRVDRLVRTRFLANPSLDVVIVGVNIWAEGGRLVYTDSSNVAEIVESPDRRYELGEERLEVLEDGGTGELVRDEEGTAIEPPQGRGTRGPVQIFTQITTSSGEPLLFEGFYALSNLEERREQIYAPFRYITVGGMAALLLLVTPIIWVLTRDVRRAGEERERLLQAGIDASDAERRRIARDLHDGVVQDLAGTSFSLAALARQESLPPELRVTMGNANDSLRASLKGLRSLLAEIHPPEIPAEGLAAALADLIAPAAAQGVQASVSVVGATDASDEQAALVLRVAQEAVRNALRHAHATTLAVTVHSDGKILVLEVVDDGVGFDPTAPRAVDRYGLKGMTSLAGDRGGTLNVVSAIGEGTAVRLEVVVSG
ncbi:MAG: histidine kinase [Nocardioides sp.]